MFSSYYLIQIKKAPFCRKRPGLFDARSVLFKERNKREEDCSMARRPDCILLRTNKNDNRIR